MEITQSPRKIRLGNVPQGATFIYKGEAYEVRSDTSTKPVEVEVENLDFGYVDIFRADLQVTVA